MDAFFLEGHQYELLVDGTVVTLTILAYSFVLGVVLSLVVGVARLSPRRVVRGAALAFVEFFRGISSIILLFVVAIAIPIVLGVDQASLTLLASAALGVNMGAYGAEIIRGSIQAIPTGQTEASVALNLSHTQRLRYVILPQALRLILPPMGNLTIEILKGTALVSFVGVTDIMQVTKNIRSQQLASESAAGLTVIFVNVLLIYFVLAQIINGLFRLAEWRLERHFQGGEAEVTDEPEPAGLIPGVSK